MKWKTALTAEEAALVAVGLERFESIEEANDLLCTYRDILYPEEDKEEYGDWSEEDRQEFKQETEELQSDISEAQMIMEALLLDIEFATSHPDQPTCLDIYGLILFSEEPGIDLYKTTVTKDSLALWFLDRDEEEIAKKFNPRIKDSFSSDKPHSSNETSPDIGSKELTYLKIIGALAQALSDTNPSEFHKKDDSVLVGYSKDSGDSGLVGHLISKKYTTFRSSALSDYISSGLNAIK